MGAKGWTAAARYRESDFGIPARFVVAPGQPLPPYHQAFRIAPNACVVCHIDIAATEPVTPEVYP